MTFLEARKTNAFPLLVPTFNSSMKRQVPTFVTFYHFIKIVTKLKITRKNERHPNSKLQKRH